MHIITVFLFFLNTTANNDCRLSKLKYTRFDKSMPVALEILPKISGRNGQHNVRGYLSIATLLSYDQCIGARDAGLIPPYIMHSSDRQGYNIVSSWKLQKGSMKRGKLFIAVKISSPDEVSCAAPFLVIQCSYCLLSLSKNCNMKRPRVISQSTVSCRGRSTNVSASY